MDREFERHPDDERVVDLEPDDEKLPPSTIDPDERIEVDDEPAPNDDERPA